MSGLYGLCSSCGLGEIGAVTLEEAAEACDAYEAEREADAAADLDDGSGLILPGDPEYDYTLRGGR
jgi:hypothetical protein